MGKRSTRKARRKVDNPYGFKSNVPGRDFVAMIEFIEQLGFGVAPFNRLVSAPDKRTKRAAIAEYVAGCRWRYEATHNALFVWRAYEQCRRADLKLPPWILAYFDRVQRALFGFLEDGNDRGDIATAVAEVMDLKHQGRGTHSAFTNFEKDIRDTELARGVQLRLNDGEQRKYAIENVADTWSLSEKTVRVAFDRFKEHLKRATL